MEGYKWLTKSCLTAPSLYTQGRASTRPSRPSKQSEFEMIYILSNSPCYDYGVEFDFLLFIAWKRNWALAFFVHEVLLNFLFYDALIILKLGHRNRHG